MPVDLLSNAAKPLLRLTEAMLAYTDPSLTHYHTMPHFDALKIYICGKH